MTSGECLYNPPLNTIFMFVLLHTKKNMMEIMFYRHFETTRDIIKL